MARFPWVWRPEFAPALLVSCHTHCWPSEKMVKGSEHSGEATQARGVKIRGVTFIGAALAELRNHSGRRPHPNPNSTIAFWEKKICHLYSFCFGNNRRSVLWWHSLEFWNVKCSFYYRALPYKVCCMAVCSMGLFQSLRRLRKENTLSSWCCGVTLHQRDTGGRTNQPERRNRNARNQVDILTVKLKHMQRILGRLKDYHSLKKMFCSWLKFKEAKRICHSVKEKPSTFTYKVRINHTHSL